MGVLKTFYSHTQKSAIALNGVSPMNFVKMLGHESRKSFTDTHDWALLVFNIKGYAQENEVPLCERPHHANPE